MINAAYGFTSILLRVFKELRPDYWAVTFDLTGPTFRHKEFKEYKATRVKAPQELYDQIPIVKQIVAGFNIPIFEKTGFEADDLIGTLVRQLTGGVEKIIVTGDNDTLQLITDDTRVYTLKKGLGETVLYDEAAVKERYGLKPDQLIDFKALRGDPSDNIPGVKGIGEKTASELLQTFGSLDKLYQALDRGDARLKKVSERIQALLKERQSDAILSKHLATIVTDVPVKFKLEDCAIQRYDRAPIVKLFQDLEFKSLLTKLPEIDQDQDSAPAKTQVQQSLPQSTKPHRASDAKYHLVDSVEKLKSLVSELQSVSELCVDTETTDIDPFRAELVGISLAWQKAEAYYLPVLAKPELKDAPAFKKLADILTDQAVAKVGHNLKFDLSVLKQAGLDLAPLDFDTMIAAYLLNPGSRRYNLEDQVFTELGYEMQPIEELIGPKSKDQRTMAEVEPAEVAWYSGEDADFTLRLKRQLESQLAKQGVAGLFHKIEMPLVAVLESMEETGIKIDAARLKKLSQSVGQRLKKLEQEIFKSAGTEFNVNSPVQLKEILFERLKIDTKGIGKTKTGLSTAASELEKMKHLHPIIKQISQNRELAKLKNTYLDALPKLINPKTGRVHTDFNQTIAATGRLSSSNPNLQNIPIRTDLGNEIRKAFVAERGRRLVAVDYSQIELRVIASLANDPAMIKTFERGEDIHTHTASVIHDVPIDKVTKNLRRLAKEVNFGIIYSLGPFGLAERQGISREKAKAFIEKYLSTYSKVREWLEATKEEAHKVGYVETIFGRRRYLPEINSSNQMLKAAAERIAVNMPIQGTAADLMKLAMLKVAQELPKEFPKARMLLQVHDELVLEAPASQAEAVGRLVQKLMVGVAKLRVPVEAAVEIGLNWGSLKKVSQ